MNSPFRWYGGKKYFLKYLYPFPKHNIYVELFGGSGVVLLNKPQSPIEVYNDINNRLVNFFRVLQNQCEELQYLCRFQGAIRHRGLFLKYREPSTDTLEDAFRFFYCNRYSFSGLTDKYGVSDIITLDNSKDLVKSYWGIIDKFTEISTRIKSVNFENKDFTKLIIQFDTPDTLFYADPPYVVGGEAYEKMIGNDSHWTFAHYHTLINMLKQISGKFILSTDTTDLAEKSWNIEQIERINNFSNTTDTQNKRIVKPEYIIRNFNKKSMITQSNRNQRTLTSLIKKKSV